MIGRSGKPLGVGLSPVWPGPGTKGDVLGTTTADDEELLGGAEEVLSGADELLGGTDELLSEADELLGGTDALVGGAFDVLDGPDELVLGGTDDVLGGVGVEEGQDTQNTLCLAAPCSPVNVQKSL